MTTTTVEAAARYKFKAGRYSSHGLLLAEFPLHGEGKRVLDVGCAVGYLSAILADRGFKVTSVD
jgi:2-polyprenyl-3-methyl-5-hydroxy-6-metoxy-1,4-benzoquinol methylase